jgi:hypothetical protein
MELECSSNKLEEHKFSGVLKNNEHVVHHSEEVTVPVLKERQKALAQVAFVR